MTDTQFVERIAKIETRLDAHDCEIKDVKNINEALYKLTFSVDTIANGMVKIETDVSDVKKEVNELKQKPMIDIYNAHKSRKKLIMETALKIVVTSVVTGTISIIATLIATGVI